jgi:hypothetical protein
MNDYKLYIYKSIPFYLVRVFSPSEFVWDDHPITGANIDFNYLEKFKLGMIIFDDTGNGTFGLDKAGYYQTFADGSSKYICKYNDLDPNLDCTQIEFQRLINLKAFW